MELRILQPTSSTIQYTVSTRSVPKTLSTTLGRYLSIVTRVLAGVCTVLLLWTKWRLTCENPTIVLQWIPDGAREARLLESIEAFQWNYLAPTTILVLYLIFRRGYTGIRSSVSASNHPLNFLLEESLTLLRGLGVQTSTTSSTYLQTPTTRFIPTTSIQDIYIHEAFRGFEVRFYLAIVVEGEQSVVVVFPSLLPTGQCSRKCGGARGNVYGKRRDQ